MQVWFTTLDEERVFGIELSAIPRPGDKVTWRGRAYRVREAAWNLDGGEPAVVVWVEGP